MPRIALQSLVILSTVVLAGCLGGGQPHSTVNQTTSRTQITTGTHSISHPNSSILTQTELLSQLNESGTTVNASLYYVGTNGTWFHASVNETAGSPAPNGSVIAKLVTGSGANAHPTRYPLSQSQRPIYVWKVVSSCDTEFYNASNASRIGGMAIIACGAPSRANMT